MPESSFEVLFAAYLEKNRQLKKKEEEAKALAQLKKTAKAATSHQLERLVGKFSSGQRRS